VLCDHKDFTLWRFLTFLSASEPFDVLFQDVVGWVRHSAVIIALHLIDGDVGMPREFQHAPKIGLFLVAAIEFFLPGADRQHECLDGTSEVTNLQRG